MSGFPAAALSTIVIALLQAHLRKSTKTLLKLIPEADRAELIKGAIHGTHAGTEYRVRAVDLNKAIVSVVCEDLGRVRLSKRRLFDHWGAWLCPHEPFTTSDPRFDESVLVQTRDTELARRWLADREVRRLAQSFKAGCSCAVHLDGMRLKAPVPLSSLKAESAVRTLHATVETLVRMTEPLRTERAHAFPPPAPKYDAELKTSWWLCGTLFALSGTALLLTVAQLPEGVPLEGTRTELLLGVGAGTVAAALATALLAKLVARRSAPWRVLWIQALVMLVAGAFLVPVLGRLAGWLLTPGGATA